MSALYPYGYGMVMGPQRQRQSSDPWGVPTTFGGWNINPQGAMQAAQAQGMMLANMYMPSIMQSMGFEPYGGQIRNLISPPQPVGPTREQQELEQAEQDGGAYLWRLGPDGQPRRWHRTLWTSQASPFEPRPGAMTGAEAAAMLRQRMPKPSDAQPVMTNPAPPRGAMSMSDFWGRK